MDSFEGFLSSIVSRDAMIRQIAAMGEKDGAVLLLRRIGPNGNETYVFSSTGDISAERAYLMAGCYQRAYDQIKRC